MKSQSDHNSTATEPALPWTGERLVPILAGQIAMEHLHRYSIAQRLAEGKDVLDIASGEGYGSALLAQTARSVVGVDISLEAVEHASRKYNAPNIRFLHGDCRSIPIADASVDMVSSFETIEHITEHEGFLEEVLRVLRPGGVFIVSTPEIGGYNETFQHTNPFHLKEMSREEFTTLLQSRFTNVALYCQRFAPVSVMMPEEARQHQGFDLFQGNYDRIQSLEKLPNPVYVMAVCSQSPLPLVDASLFEFHAKPVSAERQPAVAETEAETITRLSVVIETQAETIRQLHRINSHLRRVVASATRWQQRSWITRAFHRWRAPSPAK